jgi:hypothetical protein
VGIVQQREVGSTCDSHSRTNGNEAL